MGRTPLFRLRSAHEVHTRLAFRNTGPGQDPAVIAGHLDGRGMDAGFDEVLYLLNVAPDARVLALPEEAGKRYVLHPVQAAPAAVDARPRQARYEAATGRFEVPGRSVVVFVVKTGEGTR